MRLMPMCGSVRPKMKLELQLGVQKKKKIQEVENDKEHFRTGSKEGEEVTVYIM